MSFTYLKNSLEPSLRLLQRSLSRPFTSRGKLTDAIERVASSLVVVPARKNQCSSRKSAKRKKNQDLGAQYLSDARKTSLLFTTRDSAPRKFGRRGAGRSRKRAFESGNRNFPPRDVRAAGEATHGATWVRDGGRSGTSGPRRVCASTAN